MGGRPRFWHSTRFILYLMVVLSVLAVTAMVGVTDRGVWRISREEDRLIEAGVTVMSDAYRLKIAAERQIVGTRGFALTGQPRFLEPYTEGAEEFQVSLRHLRERLNSSEEQAMLAAISRLEGDYRTNAQRIIASKQGGAASADLLPLIERGERLKDGMITELDRLITAQEQKVQALHAGINRTEARIRGVLWTIAGACSLLVLGMAFLVVRRAAMPLSELENATRAMAAGDLDVQVPRRHDDEFGHVADAFNRMARQLQESIGTLRTQATLLSNAYDAMLARDVEGNRLTYWNRGAEQQYGYTAEEALGQAAFSLMKPCYSESLQTIQETLLATGRWEGEVHHLHREGREVIAEARWSLLRDAEGRPMTILENNHDVTARRQAERELEELRRRQRREFEQFVRSVKDYAVYMLDVEGRVVTWNEGAEQIKGYTEAEIVGEPFTRFFTPEDREAGKPEHLLREARERGHVRDEGWRVRKRGDRYWAEASLTALRNDWGQVTGFIKITRDLTAQREMQRTRREVETLKQIDQMKEHFLSLLSHELRTPINAIMGFGSILQDEVAGTLTPEQQRYMQKIMSGADTLLYLVNDLLDMSRMAAGKFHLEAAPMRFGDTVDTVLETLRPLADLKQQTLLREMPEDLPGLVADAQRVGQVLINLVGNAIKYTPQGGTIRLRACRDAEGLRCEIQDDGPGISASDQAQLFLPFFRTRESAKLAPGTGLGLSISKALVEAHHGRIGVESAPGKGSTFWFVLPVENAG